MLCNILISELPLCHQSLRIFLPLRTVTSSTGEDIMTVLQRHYPLLPRAAQSVEGRWTGQVPTMGTKAVITVAGTALMVAVTLRLTEEHPMASLTVDNLHGPRTGILGCHPDLRHLQVLTTAWTTALGMCLLLGAEGTTVPVAAGEPTLTHISPAIAVVVEGTIGCHRETKEGAVRTETTEDMIEIADTMIEPVAAGREVARLYEIATETAREIVTAIFTGDSVHQERRQDSQDSIRIVSSQNRLSGKEALVAVRTNRQQIRFIAVVRAQTTTHIASKLRAKSCHVTRPNLADTLVWMAALNTKAMFSRTWKTFCPCP